MIKSAPGIILLTSVYGGGLFIIFFIGFLRFCFKKGQFNWTPVLFWILAGWCVTVNLTIPRDLDFTHGDYLAKGWHFALKWDQTMLMWGHITTVILLICLFSLLSRAVKEGIPRVGYSLWVCFVLFSLSIVVSAFLGSPGGGFSHRLFYAPMIMTIVWLTVNTSASSFIGYAKKACLVFIWGSLIVAFISPDWALLSGLKSSTIMFSQFPQRLFGVASNSNALAPIAVCYIYLDLMEPDKSRMKFVSRLAAIIVLIMTQSRTNWIAILVGLLILWILSSKSPENGLNLQKSKPTVFLIIKVVCIGTASILIMILALTTLSSGDAEGLLHGRMELWKVSLAIWDGNRIFGYGPELWSEHFRFHYLSKNYAGTGQAHNMFFQTLSMTGLFGFTFLLALLMESFRVSWKTRNLLKGLPQGLPLCFFSLLLIRCLTESPLNSRNPDETMLVNMIIFGVLIMLDKGRAGSVAKKNNTVAD